ncbi:MAG: SdpI family protein, partial [Halanaerobiales bacterium]
YELDISRIVVVGAALLFIVMGNYLPKVKHNYFVGVRVPWTLASEKVWKKTHRFAGKLFVISGIIIFLSIFVSEIIRFWLIMICALVTSLASMVYSYLVYRQEEG